MDARAAAETRGQVPPGSSAVSAHVLGEAPPEAIGGGRGASREEILTRYRHLRELNTRFQSEALGKVSKAAFLDRARQIGLAWRDAIIIDSFEAVTLIYDLSLYTAPAGR